MYNLKHAKNYAANLAVLHNEPWSVIELPEDSLALTAPNCEGPFCACKESELDVYTEGGCRFVMTFYPVKGRK